MAALIFTHSARIALLIAAPVLPIGAMLGPIVNHIYPPKGGGWFEGLQGVLIADLILAWLWIWFLLMLALQLVLQLAKRRRETA